MGFDFGKGKTTAQRGRPSFISRAAAAPDPLADVEYTDNLEHDSRAELDALAEGFRSRRDQEVLRFKDATDSAYWFAVCFRTRADKEAFLQSIGATRLGDKYLDGHQLARVLGAGVGDARQ